MIGAKRFVDPKIRQGHKLLQDVWRTEIADPIWKERIQQAIVPARSLTPGLIGMEPRTTNRIGTNLIDIPVLFQEETDAAGYEIEVSPIALPDTPRQLAHDRFEKPARAE